MKTIKSQKTATKQAAKMSELSGVKFDVLELIDGTGWLVGTADEIAEEIENRLIAALQPTLVVEEPAPVEVVEEVVAEVAHEITFPEPATDVKAAVIEGEFYRQTNEMVAIFMGGQTRKPSWFKRVDLLDLQHDGEGHLKLRVADGFKHCGKIYKAA